MKEILIEPKNCVIVSYLSNLLQTSAEEAFASGDTFKVGLSGDIFRTNINLNYSLKNTRITINDLLHVLKFSTYDFK